MLVRKAAITMMQALDPDPQTWSLNTSTYIALMCEPGQSLTVGDGKTMKREQVHDLHGCADTLPFVVKNQLTLQRTISDNKVKSKDTAQLCSQGT